MALTWHRENPPRWDEPKARIIGGVPAGTFGDATFAEQGVLGGDWFRVDGETGPVGYGWMDTVWGDAEILLAVDPGSREQGVGAFILDRLALEARARGLRYLFNRVSPQHPDGERVAGWLTSQGFEASGEDQRWLRRRVPAS